MPEPHPPIRWLPLVGNAPLADVGVSFVLGGSNRAQALGGLGFAFAPKSTADFGVDGHLEVIDQLRQATGRLIGVQIKTGNSGFARETPEGWLQYSTNPQCPTGGSILFLSLDRSLAMV